MKTAVLITHSHPPAATEAVKIAAAVAHEVGWRLVATAEEIGKHDHAADRVERVEALPADPDLCLVLGGDGSILYALRRFARSGVPVFGVNFGTVGFLAAVERDEAEAGIRRALAGEIETIELPGLVIEAEGEERIAFNDVSFSRRPHDRVAELSLPDRRRGGGQRALRRSRRRHPGRIDRLQPRQPGTDPRLGREGLRGQLHLAPLADRARPGRRAGRRAHRRQRDRPRAG